MTCNYNCCILHVRSKPLDYIQENLEKSLSHFFSFLHHCCMRAEISKHGHDVCHWVASYYGSASAQAYQRSHSFPCGVYAHYGYSDFSFKCSRICLLEGHTTGSSIVFICSAHTYLAVYWAFIWFHSTGKIQTSEMLRLQSMHSGSIEDVTQGLTLTNCTLSHLQVNPRATVSSPTSLTSRNQE